MTPKKRGTAVGAAAPHTQTENPRRNPEGVCVPEGAHAHRNTKSAFVGTFERLFTLSTLLMLAAFALFVWAFAELTAPAHITHATIAIAAGAVLFIAGQGVGS